MGDDLAMHRAIDNRPAGIGRLVRPRSIVIVGASDKPGSLGAAVLRNLERQGFDGAIHLINPKRDRIGDRPCVATIADLPAGVDVAVLAIPRAGVLDAVTALAARGTGAAVIFSAGFAEGGEDGLAEQREIARIASETGMIVEGPNCLGLVNFRDNVSLTFVEMPEPRVRGERQVGIVSQSGAMAAVLATTMIERDVPLTCYISTGNEAASGVEDYVEYLIADEGTDVIAMVVEHFRQPARFLAAARSARAAGKRIVLLHPGRSDAARASAATHTGAMAGDHAVMRVHVERAGVIVTETLEELGDVTEIALRCQTLPFGGTAVVAESGAYKALTLDLCEDLGIPLPDLHDDDSPALRAALPDFVPVSNPLDVTAQGLVDPGLYGRTLSALASDARIDTIVVTLIQTMADSAHIKFAAVTQALAEIGTGKPILVAGLDEGGGVDDADIAALRQRGVPYFPTTERLFRALRTLRAHADRSADASALPSTRLGGEVAGGVIPEHRAKALLAPLGFPFPPAELATSVDQATSIAARLGYPVVLKAQSRDLSHKSDAGGVIVGLADDRALAAGWQRLHANVSAARPELVLDGVLVEKMGDRGIELIVGARNDPDWGPVILVGSGGVTAELLHDVRLLPTDLTRDAIMAELGRLKLAALLTGFRGSPKMDVGAVADVVMALGSLMRGEPAIREVDLNPVVVYPRGAVILDALISMA